MQDPVRSFTGREKYKRPLWATNALDNPSVVRNLMLLFFFLFFFLFKFEGFSFIVIVVLQTVQEMVMLSSSVLIIKWTIRGKPKSFIAGISGDLIIKINSQFTLNQISGQVIEHEEFWDLPSSSVIAQAFFWTSRRLFATIESGKDLSDLVKGFSSRLSKDKENPEIYPDPSGDPTKVSSFARKIVV